MDCNIHTADVPRTRYTCSAHGTTALDWDALASRCEAVEDAVDPGVPAEGHSDSLARNSVWGV